MQARLEDIFGDNGMISTVICRRTEQRWDIDSWIMSCRVLGRRVEEAILQHLVSQARMAGIGEIIGRYIATARNALVRDHYNGLGFVQIAAENGETVWRLAIENYCEKDWPMTINARRLEEPA